VIEFAQPWALLALAALPIVVALHLLRPRRRTLAVSTTALWREALRERERGLGLQRLLRNLSLLLILLAALAAALALGDPRWLTRAVEGEDTVLVLDASASMQAREGTGTRFARAVNEAHALIDALPDGARLLIMSSARRALLRTGFERDKDTLRRALDAIAPGDEAGRPRDAIALALSLLGSRERGRVQFITDAAFDPQAVPDSPRVVLHTIGAPARNLAITRFDIRPEPGGEERFQVLLTIRNYTDAALSVPTTVTLERRTLIERAVEVAANAEHTVVLAFRGKALGRASAHIDAGDALAADDRAFAVVNVPEPLRVLLVTPGNFYLESVLGALPATEASITPEVAADSLARLARAHDVVIFDRVPAPRLPPGNFMLIDASAPGLPWRDAGTVAMPQLAGRGASALLRDLDLAAVRIDAARRLVLDEPPPAGLQRLFWSADTDLALALLDGDRRLVYLGFDLARSNFALQTAFPLFISQALEWLRPRGSGDARTRIAAGERVTIQAPASQGELIMRLPSGEGRSHLLDAGRLVFDDTAHAGIYRYSVSQVTRYFAVNAGDPQESDIRPRAHTPPASGAQGAGALEARVVKPLWPALTMLVLGLLALEWTLRCLRPRDA
jgi:hypothetical protein